VQFSLNVYKICNYHMDTAATSNDCILVAGLDASARAAECDLVIMDCATSAHRRTHDGEYDAGCGAAECNFGTMDCSESSYGSTHHSGDVTSEGVAVCNLVTVDYAAVAHGKIHTGGDDAGKRAAECNFVTVDRAASDQGSTPAVETVAGERAVEYYIPPRKTFQGLCPICGGTKDISHTANCRTIAIASQADPDTVPLFEAAGVCAVNDSFRVCALCTRTIAAAIKLICATSASSRDYISSIMRKKTARKPAKILSTVFESERKPLIALFRSLATHKSTLTFDASCRAKAATPSLGKFAVGDTVLVRRRNAVIDKVEDVVGEVLDHEVKSVAGNSGVFYSVKFATNRNVELGVPENFLEHSAIVINGTNRCRPVVNEAETTAGARVEESEEIRQENDRFSKYIHDLKAEAAAKALAEAKAADHIRDLETEAAANATVSEELRQEVARLQSRVNNLEEAAKRNKLQWEYAHSNYIAAQRSKVDLITFSEELTQKKAAQCNLLERAVDRFLDIAIDEASSGVTSANMEYLRERRQDVLVRRKEDAKDMQKLKAKIRNAARKQSQHETALADKLGVTSQQTASSAPAKKVASGAKSLSGRALSHAGGGVLTKIVNGVRSSFPGSITARGQPLGPERMLCLHQRREKGCTENAGGAPDSVFPKECGSKLKRRNERNARGVGT